MSRLIKTDIPDETNKVSEAVVDSAFQVHKQMGPGLLESIYESCLVRELEKKGVSYERQKEIPVFYDGKPLSERFRVDLMVEEKVVVELKAVDSLLPIHQAQVMTYLKLTGVQVGLLINFNVRWLKHGIQRVVLSR